MMTLGTAFMLFVIVFGVIGAMRGWAKELLVVFAVLLSLFILDVVDQYVPPLRTFLHNLGPTGQFWVKSMVVVLMVFFGYQTPRIPRFATDRFVHDRLTDTLLGLVFGLINGFLIVGTIWYFMEQAKYPYPNMVMSPQSNLPGFETVKVLLPILAPRWLAIPAIFIAVGLFGMFILMVFV